MTDAFSVSNDGESYRGGAGRTPSYNSIGRRNAKDGTITCLPCAKGKRKCSGGRPCCRCLAIGKADSCVDAPPNYKKLLHSSGAASITLECFSSTSSSGTLATDASSHGSPSDLVLASHFNLPLPKISVFNASPAGIRAWSSATGLSYSLWNDACIHAALPTGLPYVDSEAFAAFWKTVAPSALQSSRPFLDECLELSAVPALPYQAMERGIVPIPEDYLQSVMVSRGLDVHALASIAAAPQSERVQSPLMMHWELMTDLCAEAALRDIPVPAVRIVFSSCRFIPRSVFGNNAFQALTGILPEQVLDVFKDNESFLFFHPSCVLARVLSGLDMRNRGVRQSKFRGVYLRHLPAGPRVGAPLDHRSRTFNATELIRTEYWPNGAMRCITTYLTDIHHNYSHFLSPQSINSKHQALFAISDAPDDFVEVSQASRNFGFESSIRSMLLQPGVEDTLSQDPILSPLALMMADTSVSTEGVSRRALIVPPRGLAALPGLHQEILAAGLSLIAECASKNAALRKPATDAALDIQDSTFLRPNTTMYDVGPTPGVEMRFGHERVVIVPEPVHRVCVIHKQLSAGFPTFSSRFMHFPTVSHTVPSACQLAVPSVSMFDPTLPSPIFSMPVPAASSAMPLPLCDPLQADPSLDIHMSGAASSAFHIAAVDSATSNNHFMNAEASAIDSSRHSADASVGSALSQCRDCAPRMRIASRGLFFTCSCTMREYCCSVDTLGASLITWAALHKSQLKDEAMLAFHACKPHSTEVDAFEHDVYVPPEYVRIPARTNSGASDGATNPTVHFVWNTVAKAVSTGSRSTKPHSNSRHSPTSPRSPHSRASFTTSGSTYSWFSSG